MATFKVQIEDLTESVSDDTALTQWLTDGAKEIINVLPPVLLQKCKDFSTLDTSPNSLTNIDTKGDILTVMRNDGSVNQVASYIESRFNGQVTDSTSLYFATVGTPKWTVYGTNLYVYPTPSDAQPAYIEHVQYPTVAHGDSAITKFPDEAEHLVVLYAAIKGLQRLMTTLHTSTAIDTTAFAAIVAELNKVDEVIDTAKGKVDNFYTDTAHIDDTTELYDGTNRRFKEVRDALINAKLSIDTGFATDELTGASDDANTQSAGYWLAEEDTEMVTATLGVAQMEMNRATLAINEISALLDSYTAEHLGGVNSYLATATGYLSQASGYISEINTRMARDNQKYQWYQTEQTKLQQDYDKGIQMLVGGSQS